MALCRFQCVAFHDINPKAPVHFLVIPRKQITQLSKSQDEDEKVGRPFKKDTYINTHIFSGLNVNNNNSLSIFITALGAFADSGKEGCKGSRPVRERVQGGDERRKERRTGGLPLARSRPRRKTNVLASRLTTSKSRRFKCRHLVREEAYLITRLRNQINIEM